MINSIKSSPKEKGNVKVDFSHFKSNAKIAKNNTNNMYYSNPPTATSATAFIMLTRNTKRSFTSTLENKKIEEISLMNRNNSSQGIESIKSGPTSGKINNKSIGSFVVQNKSKTSITKQKSNVNKAIKK